MGRIDFVSSEGSFSSFRTDEATAFPEILCGMDMLSANSFEDVFLLRVAGQAGTVKLRFQKTEFIENCVKIFYTGRQFDFVTTWKFHPETGIISRLDSLTNTANEDMYLTECQSLFRFADNLYRVYSQIGQRKAENVGRWTEIGGFTIELGSKDGLSCKNNTPFAALKTENGNGCTIHLIPRGDWKIRIIPDTSKSPRASLRVEAGLSDDGLFMKIAPSETILLPEILIQPFDGELWKYSHLLHRYFHERYPSKALPVVFNTWSDQWDDIQLPHLRKLLPAVKELGCEVFMIDAGWFGSGENMGWSEQLGDWHERPANAIGGSIADFEREVHSAGLGFGLWAEPERLCANAPVVKEHPEWFLKSESGYLYPDLTIPDMYNYLLEDLSRVAEDYRLDWFKLDMNHGLGEDPDNACHYRYYAAWKRLMADLRKRFPSVIWEGCAGGGMRMDAGSLEDFDVYWMSDNSDPLDMIPMFQHLSLRYLPGRVSLWSVLRGGLGLPKVYNPRDFSNGVVTYTRGRPWRTYSYVEMDMSVLSAMVGAFGISGDPTTLPEDKFKELTEAIAFYKRHRNTIGNSEGYLSAEPITMDNSDGWTSIELACRDESMLFAYRLNDPDSERRFRFQSVKDESIYRVFEGCGENFIGEFRGVDLKRQGIKIKVGFVNGANVVTAVLLKE